MNYNNIFGMSQNKNTSCQEGLTGRKMKNAFVFNEEEFRNAFKTQN